MKKIISWLSKTLEIYVSNPIMVDEICVAGEKGQVLDFYPGDFARLFYSLRSADVKRLTEALLSDITEYTGSEDIANFCRVYGGIFNKSKAMPCIILKSYDSNETEFLHRLFEKFFEDNFCFWHTPSHDEKYRARLFAFGRDVKLLRNGSILPDNYCINLRDLTKNEFDKFWKSGSFRTKLVILMYFLVFFSDWIKKNTGIDKYHVYMSQSPLCRSGRVENINGERIPFFPCTYKAERAPEIRSFVVDFDKTDGEKQKKYLEKHGLKPFMVVRTGGGYQFHFRVKNQKENKYSLLSRKIIEVSSFQDSLDHIENMAEEVYSFFHNYKDDCCFITYFSHEKRKKIMDYIRSFVKDLLCIGADINVGKINQLFRVPGFENPKYDRKSVLEFFCEPEKHVYEFGYDKGNLNRLASDLAKEFEKKKEEKRILEKFAKNRKTGFNYNSLKNIQREFRKLQETKNCERNVIASDEKMEDIHVIYKRAVGFMKTSLVKNYFRKYHVKKGHRNSVVFSLALIFKQEGYDEDTARENIDKICIFEDYFDSMEVARTVRSAYKSEHKFSPVFFSSILAFVDPKTGKTVIPDEKTVMTSCMRIRGLYYRRKKNSFRIINKYEKIIRSIKAVIVLAAKNNFVRKKEILEETGLGKSQFDSIVKYLEKLGIISRRYCKEIGTSVYFINIDKKTLTGVEQNLRNNWPFWTRGMVEGLNSLIEKFWLQATRISGVPPGIPEKSLI